MRCCAPIPSRLKRPESRGFLRLVIWWGSLRDEPTGACEDRRAGRLGNRRGSVAARRRRFDLDHGVRRQPPLVSGMVSSTTTAVGLSYVVNGLTKT